MAGSDDSYLKKCLAERNELTPKQGYNVVIFDNFSPPGEMLTLVAHVDTKEEAEKIAAKHNEQGKTAYVYGFNFV